MNKKENIIGFAALVLVLAAGRIFLDGSMLLLRLSFGLGLGYALTRSFMGFAGSVNRLYTAGSTRLMQALMVMFVASALLSTAFLYGRDASEYNLWVNPVNLGLMLGGLLFGFGMTFSSCCASGVLTDVVTGMPRALITLLFFGMGVFLGFPVQKSASWVRNSWFSSPVGEKLSGGVYFPDLFLWDGYNGYLGASLLTVLLAGVVIVISKRYEDKRRASGTLGIVDSEAAQQEPRAEREDSFKLFSARTYDSLFVKPWTLRTGALVITGIFLLMMGITKMGWGASTPYGFWFGKFLMIFGVSPESLAAFTGKPTGVFTMPFFSHPINVQNVGIILGTLISLLLSGTFMKTFREGLKMSLFDILLFAMGGLLMGFGTRLSNGCNVGALYTPIANFSLSGWVFLLFLVLGGIGGNMVAKRIRKTC